MVLGIIAIVQGKVVQHLGYETDLIEKLDYRDQSGMAGQILTIVVEMNLGGVTTLLCDILANGKGDSSG